MMWPFVLVAALAGAAFSLKWLFTKGRRRRGAIGLVVALFVALGAASVPQTERAKSAGYESTADMRRAEEAGFTDPEAWRAHRTQIAAAEEAERAAAAAVEAERRAEQEAREQELQALRQPPADQVALLVAVADARSAYRSAANDMARGATRPQRANAICKALRSRQVADWTGEVSELSSNSEGKGVLTIRIGDDVWAGTWNNSFSDIGSNTLLTPGSAVMNSAMTLSEGQWVRFAGTFLPGETDCIAEQSMTMDGSMRKPEFVFRFTYIEPL
ncbi:MAG: hypothetical protein ACFE0R_13925 [Salinarimonas sp.]